MKPDPSLEVDTLDPHSLEVFTSELIDAGFNPVGNVWSWEGPIDPAFAGLTTATSMMVSIRDGWPFRRPSLFVEGLGSRLHLNSEGDVCLWQEGDDSYDWLTLAGLRRRIAEWCERARDPTSANPSLDAHLYFRRRGKLLTTIDLDGLVSAGFIKLQMDRSGEVGATLDGDVLRIDQSGPIPVRWYFVDRYQSPPHDLDAVLAMLAEGRAANLSRALGRLKGRMIILLIWSTSVGPNVLTVSVVAERPGERSVEALEVARTDRAVLRLRAGVGAPALEGKSVVVFGVGAIGSQVAVLLAKSGLGNLRLVDDAVLRPADVTRHAATRLLVGKAKVKALETMIAIDAPWTTVGVVDDEVWEPERIMAISEGADVVLDATGSRAMAEQLGIIVQGLRPATTLVSVALYRGGAVGRVRVQRPGGRPLHERTSANGVLIIPRGPEDEVIGWETGCGAPVINASPVAVASIGALSARTIVELLTGIMTKSADIHDVYNPFDADGFREPGQQINAVD